MCIVLWGSRSNLHVTYELAKIIVACEPLCSNGLLYQMETSSIRSCAGKIFYPWDMWCLHRRDGLIRTSDPSNFLHFCWLFTKENMYQTNYITDVCYFKKEWYLPLYSPLRKRIYYFHSDGACNIVYFFLLKREQIEYITPFWSNTHHFFSFSSTESKYTDAVVLNIFATAFCLLCHNDNTHLEDVTHRR